MTFWKLILTCTSKNPNLAENLLKSWTPRSSWISFFPSPNVTDVKDEYPDYLKHGYLKDLKEERKDIKRLEVGEYEDLSAKLAARLLELANIPSTVDNDNKTIVNIDGRVVLQTREENESESSLVTPILILILLLRKNTLLYRQEKFLLMICIMLKQNIFLNVLMQKIFFQIEADWQGILKLTLMRNTLFV